MILTFANWINVVVTLDILNFIYCHWENLWRFSKFWPLIVPLYCCKWSRDKRTCTDLTCLFTGAGAFTMTYACRRTWSVCPLPKMPACLTKHLSAVNYWSACLLLICLTMLLSAVNHWICQTVAEPSCLTASSSVVFFTLIYPLPTLPVWSWQSPWYSACS